MDIDFDKNRNEMIKIINDLMKRDPKHCSLIIKSKYNDFYDFLFQKYPFKSELIEKLYLYCNNDIKGKCIVCGKSTKFINWKLKYRKHCSLLCSRKDKESEKLRKQTSLKKYGNEYFFASDIGKQKIKERNLIKYGVEAASKSDIIKNKIKNTNIKKYGNKCTLQNSFIKEKVKKTNLKKYGVENIFSSKEVQEKIKIVIKEKYGNEIPLRNNIIKNKYKQTNLEKYGVEYISQNKDIINKGKETRRKSEYKKLLNNKKITDVVEILFSEDEYKNIKIDNLYKFRCKKCGNIFYDNLVYDKYGNIPRCPICYPNKVSIEEENLYKFITDHYNGMVLRNDRKTLNNLYELDFYLPELKLAIKYDGIWYHSERNGKDKNYHLIKTEKCEEKGIHLIHIFENEWLNQQEIIKRKILQLLKCYNKKIYARKCIIKEVNKDDCDNFLNTYHIQGTCLSKIRLGLYYKDNLISIMTFSNSRFGIGKDKEKNKSVYELTRFCCGEYNIVGGASKLFKYFLKTYKPIKIYTFADRRYSWKFNNVYNKLGFSLDSIVPPTYFYFKNVSENHKTIIKLFHRMNFSKAELKKKFPEKYNPKLTEWENMINLGYNKIWDCGKLKYIYINNNYALGPV